MSTRLKSRFLTAPNEQYNSPTPWLVAMAVWLVFMIATPIGGWTLGDQSYPLLSSLAVTAQFIATLLALGQRWSLRRLSFTAAAIMILTYLVELIGSRSGFPFGRYAYTDVIQPQLAGVPLPIPMAWMMMLAPTWGVVDLLLESYSSRLKRWYPVVFAVLSGLAFTAWDLYLDPQMVSRGLWVWQQPGGYFGIPWTNYFGWWLSSSVITLLLRPSRLAAWPLLLIYTLTWLFQALALGVFWGQPGPALAGFIGMGLFAIPAWMALRAQP